MSAASDTAPVTADVVLEVAGVRFVRNREVVLDGIHLAVRRGEMLALLGPNGGGKTTLLRIMLGLIRPDEGAVRVFNASPAAMRSRIGYVPQYSTIRQEYPASVLEMTMMGAAVSETAFGRRKLWPSGDGAREKALAILDLLGIPDLADQPVGALSGGQRQRAMVARALMGRQSHEPFILLLDEPTASIDPYGKWCFYEFLGTLGGDMTVIVVSHELGLISPMFSRVGIVNKTLTVLPAGCPDAEILTALVGVHGPDCPVGHVFSHAPGCACPQDTGPKPT